MNRIGLIVGLALLALMAAASTLFVVDQRQVAVIYALGEIKEVVTEPGLKLKLPPPFQNVVFLDRRIQTLDSPDTRPIFTAEKKSLVIDWMLKWRVAETDLGIYYAKYHDKFGQLFGRLNPGAPTTDSQWFYVFPSDIKVAGISASRSVGDFNLSAEASVRDNMPLVVNNAIHFGPTGTPRPTAPTGRTAHVNLSARASFGPSFLAQESSLVAELAWNRVLHMSDPDGELDKGRTRDASALQFIFTPSYRQVLPGLDLSVPIGLRYTLDGRSSVTAWSARGTGNANIGVEGNYLGVWQFGLNYTHYIGAAIPFNDYSTGQFGAGNPLADRNFMSLNVRRTF